MKDVNIYWEFVQLSDVPDGTVLKHVAVSFSADAGANFTLLGNVVPPEQSLFIQQLDVGNYIARCEVVDVDDAVTQTVDVPFEVPDETVPSQIVNVQVVLT